MKLALVCSQGGHLTEMDMLLPALGSYDRFYITHRCMRTEAMAKHERVFFVPDIGTNVLLMVCALVQAIWILARELPDVIVTTGSEIAIPFCWVGKLFGARIVYVETWARVHTRSGTGPLVYPVADLFFVQWPTLLDQYGPKARYEGGVI